VKLSGREEEEEEKVAWSMLRAAAGESLLAMACTSQSSASKLSASRPTSFPSMTLC